MTVKLGDTSFQYGLMEEAYDLYRKQGIDVIIDTEGKKSHFKFQSIMP